jgi:genome maintenance exonuclease 1|tara:strand:- start:149 stop:829 length:681 start_codon:yes stop_codon:yes gene_type:complete
MKNYEIKLNDGLYHFPELKTKTVDRKRFYVTPEGNEYPSITTVLSPRNKKGLMEWRKRVGNDVANHIANKAAVRGTKVHKMCEDWLNEDFSQETWDKHKKDFFPYTLFNELKNQKFEYITDVYAQEMTLYSDKYKVAGRVDLIANYQHHLSIVDFKTSTNERKDSYNENYYIQTAAYAEMFEEMTGTPINQIVILVVTENGTVQEFVKEKDEYLPLLEKTLEEWYN